jgi:hypothetical protein
LCFAVVSTTWLRNAISGPRSEHAVSAKGVLYH